MKLRSLIIAVILLMISVCGSAQGRQATAMDPGKTNTMKVGDTFSLSGHVHSSVGYEFYVEYDKEAFSAGSTVTYDNPESMAQNLCGGDSGEKTYTVTALKPGRYTIISKRFFHGQLEEETIYKIRVVKQ